MDTATDLGYRYARLVYEIDPSELRDAYCEYDSDDARIEAAARDLRDDIREGCVKNDVRHLKDFDLEDRPELEAERNFIAAEMKKEALNTKQITKNALKSHGRRTNAIESSRE